MYLTVLGINHRTAPVEIRGQVAFPPEQLARALGELTALEGVHEAAILSTCNRTELYCAGSMRSTRTAWQDISIYIMKKMQCATCCASLPGWTR